MKLICSKHPEVELDGDDFKYSDAIIPVNPCYKCIGIARTEGFNQGYNTIEQRVGKAILDFLERSK